MFEFFSKCPKKFLLVAASKQNRTTVKTLRKYLMISTKENFPTQNKTYGLEHCVTMKSHSHLTVLLHSSAPLIGISVLARPPRSSKAAKDVLRSVFQEEMRR